MNTKIIITIYMLSTIEAIFVLSLAVYLAVTFSWWWLWLLLLILGMSPSSAINQLQKVLK